MFPFNLDDERQRQAFQRYSQAVDDDRYDDVDDNQAVMHVQDFMRQAPPQMQQQVYQDYFQRAPYEQRQQMQEMLPPQYRQGMDPNDPYSMAQGFGRAAQTHFDPTPESPLQQMFGQGGALGSPLAKAAVIGIAGMIGKQLLRGGR
ncbi:MAG TPA: hypothetical protein VNT60_02995 [Deinococcales bacterium]|nr:hypothetical protein [Deinococcales bacterium]